MTPADEAEHDSGCRSFMKLKPGVRGWAIFAGDRRQHRLLLGRAGMPSLWPGYALWIGHNPSGADPMLDDLTVHKEQVWTRALGLGEYRKMNIATWRATQPGDLLACSRADHPDNWPLMRQEARDAAKVVIATGIPIKPLVPHFWWMVNALRDAGLSDVLCLGRTRAGYPRHSSRLGYATQLVPVALKDL